jgi:hypothetical protein
LQKATLHTASIERSKKWPNTIHALRAKKEAAKREKMELEEAERRKVDAEEAAFRAEQRRTQVGSALIWGSECPYLHTGRLCMSMKLPKLLKAVGAGNTTRNRVTCLSAFESCPEPSAECDDFHALEF